jgi:hypothetical protein
MKKIITLMALSVILAACDQKGSTSDTKDRARAEGEAETEVNNNNTDRRALKMEADLQKRYRFYKGVSGDFESSFKIKETTYKGKITFSPTIHILESERVRTVEEIQDDLNNLFLNAQVYIWTEDFGIIGCVFERVRADINTGVIQLFSSECTNSLEIRLTTKNTKAKDRKDTSELLAQSLVSGAQESIEYLHAEVSSKHNPNGYEFIGKKK